MTNTKSYTGSRKGAVRFVKDKQTLLNPDYASIMIIGRDISGDYSAHTVIDASWGDIERLLANSFSRAQLTTSNPPTQVG